MCLAEPDLVFKFGAFQSRLDTVDHGFWRGDARFRLFLKHIQHVDAACQPYSVDGPKRVPIVDFDHLQYASAAEPFQRLRLDMRPADLRVEQGPSELGLNLPGQVANVLPGGADPNERLCWRGRWQDGLWSAHGGSYTEMGIEWQGVAMLSGQNGGIACRQLDSKLSRRNRRPPGERQPQPQQHVRDHRAGDAGLDHLDLARAQGEEGDDHLGGVAEGGVEQPAERGAGDGGEVLSGLADERGQGDDGDGGGEEEDPIGGVDGEFEEEVEGEEDQQPVEGGVGMEGVRCQELAARKCLIPGAGPYAQRGNNWVSGAYCASDAGAALNYGAGAICA